MSCCSTNGTRGQAGGQAEVTRERERAATFPPNVDIYETADEWVVVADVPGAAEEALELGVDDGLLSLGARVGQRQPEETRFGIREYPVGDYERSFRIGDGVDTARISAVLDNGVLTIRLPKSEAVKPRKIEIRTS